MRVGNSIVVALCGVLALGATAFAAQANGQQARPDVGAAQPAPAPGARAATPGRPPRPSAYPTRQVDPAKAERGKVTFGVNCTFCHGSDARGGEGGPNLIRSELVLSDKDGETIAPVIQNGRVDRGMPKFDMTTAQISEIAAFLHSLKVGGYDISRETPPSIVVGNATEGKAAFDKRCGSCHSVTGDLQGIASRIQDPRTLQQTWMMPVTLQRFPQQGQTVAQTKVPPTTVTVTTAGGETVEGKLTRIDDFNVTLTTPDGYERTIGRNGDEPKVVIHDPLEAHRRLLSEYTDKEIHDITAYLVTVK